MKEARLNIRISKKRLEKIQNYALCREKTVTSLVEDWIDQINFPTDKQNQVIKEIKDSKE